MQTDTPIKTAHRGELQEMIVDPTYQLLKTVYPDNKVEEFNYDKAGNRLSRSLSGVEGANPTETAYTHNDNNEMLTAVIASEAKQSLFEFDANGNMTKKTEGSNVFEYLYNVENRLSAVKLNGHTLATYGYDPFGRRLWKQVEGVKTYFFYTDEGLSAEINNAGEVVKTYGYTPNSIWTTDPLWTRESGQYYFYQNDHLATPQMITSSNGESVWSADYESFGKATVRDGSSVTNNLRFPGQYFDGETGEYYNWNRNYMPGIGRYGQVDPIGFGGRDINRYRYAFNNSSIIFDNDGQIAQVFVIGGAVIAATALWYVSQPFIQSLSDYLNNQTLASINAMNELLSENEDKENDCKKDKEDPKDPNYQKNRKPPKEDVYWDPKRKRWIDSKGRVYTRHDWTELEKPHWDRGSPNGYQEKSYDACITWIPK